MCPARIEPRLKKTTEARELEAAQISERLKEILHKQNLLRVADHIGVSEGSIRKYMKGGMPSFHIASAIVELFGVNYHWLATGEGPKFINDHNDDELQHFIAVPLMDVTASAGDGRLVLQEQQSGFVNFDENWLRQTYHTNPNELFTLEVVGESMRPTIQPGEFLLVSKLEQHSKPGDGIYVIRIDGSILVKRLQVLPGRRILISSDNADMYKPYEFVIPENQDNNDFAVLGKVILVHGMRRM